MNDRYDIKSIEEIFSEEFANYLYDSTNAGHVFTKQDVKLIMKRIEQYEDKKNVTFVNFFGNTGLLIFRNNE